MMEAILPVHRRVRVRPSRLAQILMSGVLLTVGAASAASANPVSGADVAAHIAEAARLHGLLPAWIRAVIRAESGFEPRAISSAGAMGLMQVMPATYAELRTRYPLGPDPYAPRDNILAGSAYLRELYDRFGPAGFLAAYNAGPGRYWEHLRTGRPLPRETRLYVARITRDLGLFPAADLRMVAINADLIALDLRQDEYLCLPGLGAQIKATGAGWSASSDELVSGLLDTGLFSTEPSVSRRPPPPGPSRTTLGVEAGAPALIDDLRFLGAVLRYGALAKGRSVHGLTGVGRPPRIRPDAEPRVQRLTAAFARRLPWAPGQGECLYRAFLLRALLAGAGVDVTWIFGVRTWPFAAHCWLQCGDLLLDDDLDRVRLYTPIHWVGP